MIFDFKTRKIKKTIILTLIISISFLNKLCHANEEVYGQLSTAELKQICPYGIKSFRIIHTGWGGLTMKLNVRINNIV